MIKPKGYGGIGIESFESYLPKIKRALPNFPDCVIEQWVYRHFNDFINFNRINFQKVNFELITMKLEDIDKKIDSKIMQTLNNRGNELYKEASRKESRLGKYMINNKKRPKPIIITRNNHLIQERFKTNQTKDFFLIEGHMRLAYMKEIYKEERINIDQDIRFMNI